jgi:hypothetical protein
MAFWGTATLNGQPLSAGTKVQAYCGTDLVGEVVMQENGIYGYAESTKIKLLVSTCNGDVLFKYLLVGTSTSLTGGEEIKNIFATGTTVNKNLNFITIQPCNITNGTGRQTWGGSSWGSCVVQSCNSNFHQESNSCTSNTRSCSISNGAGSQTWISSAWGECSIASCNSGYHQSGNTCIANSTGGGEGGGGGGSPSTPPTTPTTTKVGDTNGDGKIDKYDFSLMMANWNKTGINASDLNGDSVVNKYDFALLMSLWGK